MSRSDLTRLNGARVLVVEGHDDTLELNRIVLARRGAEVRAACSAEAALDLLQSWPPDALLTDLRLPGMSAFELIDVVWARGGDRVPVVGTSADARPQARADAFDHGIFVYLTKPIEPDDLCFAVAEALGPRAQPQEESRSHSP